MPLSPEPVNNPFQLVYCKLWEMVENDDRFTSEVQKGNRFSFGKKEKRNVLRLNASSNDFPEVYLLAQGIDEVNLMDTSSSSKFVRTYSWAIVSGDYRLTEMFPVEWSLLCIMAKWCRTTNNLSSLKWNDKEFVTKFNVSSVSFGQSDDQIRQRIQGWTSLIDCEVQMHFTTDDLVNGIG